MRRASSKVIKEFKSEFKAFKKEHENLISGLLSDVDDKDMDDFFWDQIAELKSDLGTKAANNCSDDEGMQEDAISECETWVSDTISPGGIIEFGEGCDIALTLWLNGVEEGQQMLRKALASASKQH
ncbi:MAG: hypothetical protein ACLP29_02070 [Dissulfurispiraceae bacterium]